MEKEKDIKEDKEEGLDIKAAIKQAMAEIKAEKEEKSEKEASDIDVKDLVKQMIEEQKEVEVKEIKKTVAPIVKDVKVGKTNKYNYRGSLVAYKDTELEQAYNEGMWFKATQLGDQEAKQYCDDNNIATKAMTGDVNAAGGFTVPDQLLNRVIVLASTYGVVCKYSDVLQASSDVLWVPKRNSNVSTVWQASQGDAKTDSDAVIERVEVAIRQLYVLTYLSNQLVADSVINFIDFIVQGMAEALAREEDRVCLLGTGIAADGVINGIIPAIKAVAGNQAIVNATGISWATVVLSDFNTVMSRLADYSWSGKDPVWTCSNNFYHQVMNRLKTVAVSGNYISTIESGFRKEFMGYEVVTSPLLSTNDGSNPSDTDDYCLFGRYDQVAAFANRAGRSVTTSTEGLAFRRNEIHIRAEQRFGYTVHDEGTAAAAGSMILLQS